mgnify:CR=1 FL=1
MKCIWGTLDLADRADARKRSTQAGKLATRRADVLACWEASGRKPSAMPQTMTMIDLRVLAYRVLSTAADWRSLTFVAPESSVAACNAQAQGGL